MTFNEYLKVKLGLKPDELDMADMMDEHYDEYTDYLAQLKDGCGPGDG